MQDTPFDQRRLGLSPMLAVQMQRRDAERELKEVRHMLWLVLKAAGPVTIPRELIGKPPSDNSTVTRTQLPDGSVTMQAD